MTPMPTWHNIVFHIAYQHASAKFLSNYFAFSIFRGAKRLKRHIDDAGCVHYSYDLYAPYVRELPRDSKRHANSRQMTPAPLP